MISLITPIMLCVDLYKLDHRRQLPNFTEFTVSNATARAAAHVPTCVPSDGVVFAGLQYALQKYFIDHAKQSFFDRPKEEVLIEYSLFLFESLGPNEIGTDHIADLHDLGYMPLEFKALPEGTLVPYGVPMFTVRNTDPRFAWLTNYFESLLSSLVWGCCTSATTARQFYRILMTYAERTCDDTSAVLYQAHDFSFRGLMGVEAAEISGIGHLSSFTGSDNGPGLTAAKRYYPSASMFVGGGVPACYDDQTEILTDKGFKFFDKIEPEDAVAQYHQNGTIDFVIPTEYFKDYYTGDMISFSSGSLHYIDAMVTPNHKMVVRKPSGELRLNEAGNSPFTSKDKLIVAGKANGIFTELSDIDRLEIAFQADGSFADRAHRYTGKYTGAAQPIRFTLKRERKKIRLREILGRLGYEYTETEQEDRPGYSHFWINSPETLHKEFDWIPYEFISSQWAQEFIEEASYWDGSRYINSMQYYSSIELNTEAVTTVAILAGYKTHRSTYKDPRTTRKLQHIVSCTYRDNVGTDGAIIQKTSYEGYVYCVSVPTKMIVTRRNGSVLICGNTEHAVMCAGGQENEAETYERVVDIYPTGPVSVVSDTWDIYKVIKKVLTVPSLRKKIMERNGTLVIRPDSGNPEHVLCGNPNAPFGTDENLGVVQLLAKEFGVTVNSKGFMVLDAHIGVIQGEAITLENLLQILQRLEDLGFCSLTVFYGIGSFIYQYVTRDVHSIAFKTTYAVVDGVGRKLQKNPITDLSHQKKSAVGLMQVHRVENGQMILVDDLDAETYSSFPADMDQLKTVWVDGKFTITWSLFAIRNLIKQQTPIHASTTSPFPPPVLTNAV